VVAIPYDTKAEKRAPMKVYIIQPITHTVSFYYTDTKSRSPRRARRERAGTGMINCAFKILFL